MRFLHGEREWQMFFLAPDSGRFWSWSWCVDEPGFEAVVANDLRADPRRRHADVVLVPTSDRQRCVWRERPPAFEVVR